MSTNMIECRICKFVYNEMFRPNCPTCGTIPNEWHPIVKALQLHNGIAIEIVVAKGAKRAGQDFQRPLSRIFRPE